MISKLSEIHSDINENDVEIAAFVYVGENVKLGKNVVIHPNVVIECGAEIRDNVEIFPGAYIGKKPKGKSLATKNKVENRCFIDSGTVIGPNAIVYLGDYIGENNMIGDGVSIRENVIIGNNCIIGRNATINYGTKIGNSVKIMDLAHVTAKVIIHDYAFIGPHVCMADDNGFGKNEVDSANAGGAEIFENANLGEGVLLLPNVKIGENAIVGAGAVVTKDVEANSVFMGMPAKRVRSR